MRKGFPVLLGIGLALALFLNGCYALRSSRGGGQTEFAPPRQVNAADILLPEGYRIEPVALGLTFPTGVAFDDQGGIYVVESGYSYGEVWTVPRLLRVTVDGRLELVARGRRNGPWTGVAFHRGDFFVAEGGTMEGGRILRINSGGRATPLVENLPSRGDHHTNGPVIGPDSLLYFGIGTATNSAVVGRDNLDFGWLARFPDFHDIPCRDVMLAGWNAETENFLDPEGDPVRSGAYSPFGAPTAYGQVISGQVPCSGAVLRINPEGGRPELVAWGFRNPFGLAFSPGERLYVTDNQYDVRGSRPVFGAGDLLWEVRPGGWHGWPDFHGGIPVYEGDRYRAPGEERPPRLLARHPDRPPEPAAVLAVHGSANGFDFSGNRTFGYEGQAFIAELGDMAPDTGKVLAPAGFKVIRVEVDTGAVHDFAINRGHINGPASFLGTGGLERPVAARFSPDGTALYIVDFGVMLVGEEGPVPQAKTGVLWRVVRE